tara:strand:+ start:3841 stop:4068 length:228 start_codon:yes stop_codon:yes gene_type:complete
MYKHKETKETLKNDIATLVGYIKQDINSIDPKDTKSMPTIFRDVFIMLRPLNYRLKRYALLEKKENYENSKKTGT